VKAETKKGKGKGKAEEKKIRRGKKI